MVLRKSFTFWALATIVVLGCIGWSIRGHAKADTDKQPDVKQGAKARVQVVHPQQGGIPWSVTRPASVQSFQHANLYAKVSGYLQHQVVDIGDRVKQGELLAEIFAPEIPAGVEKAQADVRRAQAMVEVGVATVQESVAHETEAQAKLAQSQADLETAQALLKLRQQQYDRIAELARLNSIQQELVDEKFEARRAAEAAQRSSIQAIATAKAGVASAKADIVRSKADLDNVRAQVQVAQAQLAQAAALEEYTKIRSPYTGVVTSRNFHEGDFIRDATQGGSQPVLAVAETDLMRVVVWVPDRDVPKTRRGNIAVVHVDALNGREFKGQVSRTALSEDYNSRTMRTEIDVPNPDSLLSDGMFGSATIDLEKSAQGVSIPAAALQGEEQGSERHVYVVRQGHAHKIGVHVGHNDGIHAQILSGLSTDDEVIVAHGPGLEDGVAVVVSEAGQTNLASDGQKPPPAEPQSP